MHVKKCKSYWLVFRNVIEKRLEHISIKLFILNRNINKFKVKCLLHWIFTSIICLGVNRPLIFFSSYIVMPVSGENLLFLQLSHWIIHSINLFKNTESRMKRYYCLLLGDPTVGFALFKTIFIGRPDITSIIVLFKLLLTYLLNLLYKSSIPLEIMLLVWLSAHSL